MNTTGYNYDQGHEAKSVGETVDYSRLDKRFTQAPGALGRSLPAGYEGEEPMDVQSGSLKACHARSLAKLQHLQANTEMLQTILFRLDGARPPAANEIGKLKGNAEKEPDHPTFTARKIENLLEQEIGQQRDIMDQINRLIG